MEQNDAFYCLVVGSRTFHEYEVMCRTLDHLLQKKTEVVIVSGGANGADSYAERYAKEHGYPMKVFLADWNTYGKSAGYRRNKEMHEYIASKSSRGVVAFWDSKSKGTRHNFELAERYRNPIRCYHYEHQQQQEKMKTEVEEETGIDEEHEYER